MCGICGVIQPTPLRPEQLEALAWMNGSLIHRGPDGEGQFQDSHLALAMRRLSIIDLTGGWQPLYNEDRSLVLVANGEIYNYVELQAQLKAKGHHLNTGSDCETVLHLYEDCGLDFVHHLRGMFALALWDSRRRQLILARDRMGEKPLYLYETEGRLIFASELKALLQSNLVPFELDPVAVDLYFHYQYVPEPATPLKGVRKLPAAHLLTLDVQTWQIKEICYWRMEDAPPLEGDPTSHISQELEQVSELVIRSDVPVGIALSGGLDSSAIAALAVKKYPGVMQAFSVGYPDRPPNDERADAEALAKYLGMPFHQIELSTDDLVACFPQLVYWRDDPIADIAGYGYYAVMKLAQEYSVPVMLQGQGGDELFWGYNWMRQAVKENQQKLNYLRQGWASLPAYLRFSWPEHIRPRQYLQHWVNDGFGLWAGWQRFWRDKNSSAGQMVFYDLAADFQLAKTVVSTLYMPTFAGYLNGGQASSLFNFPQPWPPVDIRLTRLICDTYLRENGIAQADRLSMASSIELRLPLVDYKLVETVIGLRKTQADDALPPKAWLREALKTMLPEWVLNRPKRGFAPPVHQWHNALFARYGQQLVDGYLVETGVLKPQAGQQLSAGYFPNEAVTPLSFKALVLELWCRQMSALN
jgi:asparagine synthase (glutamine-hydrolysing)